MKLLVGRLVMTQHAAFHSSGEVETGDLVETFKRDDFTTGRGSVLAGVKNGLSSHTGKERKLSRKLSTYGCDLRVQGEASLEEDDFHNGGWNYRRCGDADHGIGSKSMALAAESKVQAMIPNDSKVQAMIPKTDSIQLNGLTALPIEMRMDFVLGVVLAAVVHKVKDKTVLFAGSGRQFLFHPVQTITHWLMRAHDRKLSRLQNLGPVGEALFGSSDGSWQLAVVSCQPSVGSCQLSALSCQFSVVALSWQLSVLSPQFSVLSPQSSVLSPHYPPPPPTTHHLTHHWQLRPLPTCSPPSTAYSSTPARFRRKGKHYTNTSLHPALQFHTSAHPVSHRVGRLLCAKPFVLLPLVPYIPPVTRGICQPTP
ncbi:hypothetical protein E6O75_ATG08964 [Venturia nashicola]|uniref:Uncharacterized protein n=1 Tax=Venturia nashicola TaxID=86259 RepID=A0A4Z1NNU3_9PEZI|nr:hypothetical protein E6O75_ATG08964 [Venturia nashicola]